MIGFIHLFIGAFIISKVETCGCKDSGCYREDYFSSFWKEVAAENGTEDVVMREKVKAV